jgi:hypothetical protein
MSTLTEKLTTSETRPRVLDACVELVENEVAKKGGFSGAAIKTGFKVVKAIKPGIVRQTLDTLLPEFANALQPIFEKSTNGAGDGGTAFANYLRGHTHETADALLTVTDKRAERAKNKTLKKTYDRLRSTAKEHVEAAVPGLADALQPFA